MSRAVLAAAALAPLIAQAASFVELLRLAHQARGSSPELPLEGMLAEQLRPRLGAQQLRGRAALLDGPDEHGCGRYALTLVAARGAQRAELATVQMNWCADWPPAPRR